MNILDVLGAIGTTLVRACGLMDKTLSMTEDLIDAGKAQTTNGREASEQFLELSRLRREDGLHAEVAEIAIARAARGAAAISAEELSTKLKRSASKA